MKKNIKLIIGIVIGIIIGTVSGVYATLTYSAGDIAYTKSGINTSISVESALNELYQNKNETTNDTKSITSNGSISLDKYYKNLNVNVPIPAGYIVPSGTKTITTKANNIDVSNYQYVDTTGMYTLSEVQSGKGKHWNSGSFTSVSGENSISVGFIPNKICFYKFTAASGSSFVEAIYDFNKSTNTYMFVNQTSSSGNKIEERTISASSTSFGFRSIGSTTKMYVKEAGITYYWIATE